MKATKQVMKVRAAKAPKVQETKHSGYRVYRPDDQLREAIKAKREATNTTNKAVIEAAITEKLPVLVSGLASLALTARVGAKRRPARWQVSDDVLGALKVAAAQTGLPQSTLLMAALSLTCETTPKARKTKGGAK